MSKLKGLKTAESGVFPSIASIFALPSTLGGYKSNPSLYLDPGSDYVSSCFCFPAFILN